MAENFGQRMARLRKRRKGKGKRKGARRAKAPKLSKRVVRSAAASKRTAKRRKTPKRAKAHKVRARDVGARLTALEGKTERLERNVAGIAVWARGMTESVRRIYGLTGNSLGGGATRGLPSGRS
jgi:hypothetical protein